MGENPKNSSENLVYVGESESISNRLKQHMKDEGKNFWRKVIILSSKSGSLNKAHIKSIESTLIKEIDNIKAVELANNSRSIGSPHLALHDQINVNRYVSRFKLILKSLGINFFSERRLMGLPGPESESPTVLDYSNPIFEIQTVGAKAYGRVVGQNFVLSKGSTFRVVDEDQYGLYARQMISKGILVKLEGNFYVLSRDTAFASHSLAASMVAGKQRSGWTSWKIKGTGITFKAWEEKMSAIFGLEFEFENGSAKFFDSILDE